VIRNINIDIYLYYRKNTTEVQKYRKQMLLVTKDTELHSSWISGLV